MDEGGAHYNLSMRIKNGTENWCVTALSLTFRFGDARGQEWLGSENPAVERFTLKRGASPPAKGQKFDPNSATHSVGLSPGQNETHLLYDVYAHIQTPPTEYYNGFHIISGAVKSCTGYRLEP